jgi:hypothetical protein
VRADFGDAGADVGCCKGEVPHRPADRTNVARDLDAFAANDAIEPPKRPRLRVTGTNGFYDLIFHQEL